MLFGKVNKLNVKSNKTTLLFLDSTKLKIVCKKNSLEILKIIYEREKCDTRCVVIRSGNSEV